MRVVWDCGTATSVFLVGAGCRTRGLGLLPHFPFQCHCSGSQDHAGVLTAVHLLSLVRWEAKSFAVNTVGLWA